MNSQANKRNQPAPVMNRTFSRLACSLALASAAAMVPAASMAQVAEPTTLARAVATPAKPYPDAETALARLADEAAYAGKTRSYLQSIARYPASRETSLLPPQGQVTVWLEIERDGALADAGIARSSHSMPLDSAALATVRRAQYPAWPTDLFPGEARRRFTVTFDYGRQQAK